MAQLHGLHTLGVMVVPSFMTLSPLRPLCNSVIENIILEVVCETAKRDRRCWTN